MFGSAIGGALGSLGSSLFPINGLDGQAIGKTIGGWFPFKKGGLIKSQPVLQPINYAKLMKRGGVVKRKYQKPKK